MLKYLCSKKSDSFYEKAGLFVLVILALRVLYYLVVYGDVFPQWDEWKYFPVWYPFYKYLFDFNNENLQFFTNAQFALLQYLRLPFKANVFFSYGIYLLLITRYYLFLRQHVQSGKWLLLLCFVPLFSDYMLDNLFWPILSQTWFYFLFMIEAVRYGFNRPHRCKDRNMALFMITLSVLAMNVSFIILFLSVYLLKNIYNAQGRQERNKEFLFMAMCLEYLAIVLTVFFFFMREADKTDINFNVLFSAPFYHQLAYFFASPLFGLWGKPDNVIFNLILFLVVAIWVLSLFVRQVKNVKWQSVWALFLILAGNIVAITIFRGGLVYHVETHAGRYLPFALFLLPIFYVITAGEKNGCLKKISYMIIFAMLGSSFSGLFNGRHLSSLLRIKNADLCVFEYYNAPVRPLAYFCPDKHGGNIAVRLEQYESGFLKNLAN